MDHTSIASQSQVHVDVQSKIDEFFGRFKIATLMHQCGVFGHNRPNRRDTAEDIDFA